MRCLRLAVLLMSLTACSSPNASPQGIPGDAHSFEEAFALAEDREAALERLLPGTEDAYFYRCLHLQHTGALEAVGPVLGEWVKRFGRTQRVIEIEHRQALLNFNTEREESTAYLKRALGLHFDHQPSTVDRAANLASTLDATQVTRERFVARELSRHGGTVDGLTDEGVRALASETLDDKLLDSLLARLERPDVPGLAALIVRNLKERRRSFGSLPIHERLTLEQLRAIGQAVPKEANDSDFVFAVLRRLAPSDDVNWRTDAGAREAYLTRLEEYAATLNDRWDSMRAHVLHHRLIHELEQGTPDETRFRRYLALPWHGSWVGRELTQRRRANVNPGTSYPTGLSDEMDAESLVRTYLEALLVNADSPDAFAQWVDADYLRRVFAEAKILGGVGDRDRWFDLLGNAAEFERLRDRVELDFAPDQQRRFAATDPVAIDLRLKNVETLLVKVFEIDARNAFSAFGREVDASLPLDGLVANEEVTHTFEVDPLLRVARSFEFPSLTRAGVFVIEFVGNGLSSRAVIHKGRLVATERRGAAGHVFRVFDEAGAAVSEASILFGDREFTADASGEILVPYASDSVRRTMLLTGGGAATVDSFMHRAENYDLEAGAMLVREDLVGRGLAQLVVRPRLLVNDASAHLQLLEDSVLRIVATDVRGVETSVEVRDPELTGIGEFVHEIPVLEDLVQVTVGLSGKVERVSGGDPVDVASDVQSFSLNGILRTAETGSVLLSRTSAGYVLDHLGRNGEPLAGRALRLSLWHRETRSSYDVSLATDSSGRITLGQLEGIVRLQSSGLPNGFDAWNLDSEARSQSGYLHGFEGAVLRVPVVGDFATLDRGDVSLLELRGGVFAHDRFEKVSFRDGFLELRGLAAGDYDLRLGRTGQSVAVRVAASGGTAGWAAGGARLLALDAEPMHLVTAEIVGEELVARLANAGEDARVHVLVTRTLPAYDAFDRLALRETQRDVLVSRPQSEAGYYAEREIGAEYRYILDRRRATKFPGVMLARPGALLNPWAFEEASDMIGLGGGAGGKFGGKAGGRKNVRAAGGRSGQAHEASAPGAYAHLDFLGDGAVLLLNLRPDESGVVRVPTADLGPGAFVRVLALDRMSTVERSLVRAESAPTRVDARLLDAIASDAHVVERRRIEFVDGGGSVELEAVAGTRAETFDSLGKVYQLFRTLSDSTELAEFAFLVEWPSLDDATKLELYSKYACHELHVFLHEKDRRAFDAVVRPYLVNKVHKTFLDRWLLDEDLTEFLEPHAFGRLNVVEQILLARRVDDPGVTRLVQDRVDLLPPNPAGDALLFDKILAGDALSQAVGLRMELGKAATARRAKRAAPAPTSSAESRTSDFFLGQGQKDKTAESLAAPEVGFDAAMDELAEEEAEDMLRRDQVQQLYQPLAVTKAHIEHNYWHRRIQEQNGSLVQPNRFWRDFAVAPANAPFVSSHVGEATANVAEMLLALSFLDLPFAAGEHETTNVDGRLVLRPASPLLVAHERLEPATPAVDGSVLVGQQYVRLDERFEYIGGEQRDKLITGEFLVGVPYACRIVVTNPTSTPKTFEVLAQVPAGSIPLMGAAATRSASLRVAAYGTANHEFAFYFPSAGSFGHYPAHATHDGELVAFGAPMTLDVVGEATEVDTDSWNYLVDRAEPAVVLAALGERNLLREDLSRLAWRMKDPAFFAAATDVLDSRHLFDATLWSYALRHEDTERTRQYLESADGFLAQAGPYLESPIVSIDPVARLRYEIVEFSPLVHARSHDYGDDRHITHQGLAAQVRSLLEVLVRKPELDSEDWLLVTTTFLAQDRFPEALAAFERVDRNALQAQLQVDYVEAYLAMLQSNPERARALSTPHLEHPVERWRTRFATVVSQLDELAGTQSEAQVDPARVAALELELDGNQVTVRHEHVGAIEVGFYETDVEFLFSSNPFGSDEAGSVAFVRPNAGQTITPASAAGETLVAIPAELVNANLVVEVRSGGLVRRRARYASDLDVRSRTSAGELDVRVNGTGLAAAYVKVYARRANGQVEFHKDGYTDLRGRFDYVSLTGSDAIPADRYAVLVLHSEHGAVVRELEPPVQ